MESDAMKRGSGNRLKNWIAKCPTSRSPASCSRTSRRCSRSRPHCARRPTFWQRGLPNRQVDQVVGIEARGFIFAPLVAYRLNVGFVPVRKPGKLPAATAARSYELEYGSDALELHVDGLGAGDRVALVDDLLATGGTARAAADLVESVGARVEAVGFVVELTSLEGRRRLEGYDVVESLVRY